MDLEVAIAPCKDGNSAGMIQAMEEAGTQALLSVPGCNSVKVLPGVENPGTVILMIEWDSVDAHNAGTSTEGFGAFLAAAGPFLGEGITMQHFRLS